MGSKSGSFIWFELMTPDADAAAAFYGAVVGWKIGGPAGMPGAPDYRMIQRSDGGHAGGVLQLTPDMLAHGARPVWLPYLQVANVDAAIAAITADGGRLLMPRRDLPVGAMAMLADPAGTPFYVMAPVPPPGQPDAVSDVFHPRLPQRIRWNELAIPDLDRAKAFYAKHFEFAFNEVMSMGPMGDYCFIDHDDVRVGALMPKPADGPASGWLPYFGVALIDAAQAAITAGGGQVLRPAHEVPGGEWVVIATDPQGALFGVVGPKEIRT